METHPVQIKLTDHDPTMLKVRPRYFGCLLDQFVIKCHLMWGLFPCGELQKLYSNKRRHSKLTVIHGRWGGGGRKQNTSS
jgi:hypothetical protein